MPNQNDPNAKLAPRWRDTGLDPDYVDAILACAQREDLRQLSKWGLQVHSPAEWLAIVTEEFGEAAKEIVELHFAPDPESAHQAADRFEAEMIQVVTLLLKMGRMARYIP